MVAANHCSYIDPLVLGAAVPRRLVYLVTSDVYYLWWLRPFFWSVGCIPIQEEQLNVEALRRALDALRSGHVVGIFPEGAISNDGRVKEGAQGVASLLLKANVPVQTASLRGTFEALPRHRRMLRMHKIEVEFGEQLHPKDLPQGLSARERRRLLVERVMGAIREKLQSNQQ